MSTRRFTEEQVKTLLQNSNVERCSKKSITYSKEFKVRAVKQYHEGLPPNEIFRRAMFNVTLIGAKTPKRCLQSWRRIFDKKGIKELSIETRGKGKGGGRPKIKWTDDKEKIKSLEAEVAYLKAENDFLAKLRKKS